MRTFILNPSSLSFLQISCYNVLVIDIEVKVVAMTNLIENSKKLPDDSYLKRIGFYCMKNGFGHTVDDYPYFPSIELPVSDEVFNYKKNRNANLIDLYKYEKHDKSGDSHFRDTLVDSGTTAFILIKDDKVLVEEYFNGQERNIPHRMFSITKSVTSALIGIALDDGLIESIDDPITQYIPELRANFSNITINMLMNMQSGIKFTEGKMPWHDDTKIYLHPDSSFLINQMKITDEVGKFFHYNDIHPLIIGEILMRQLRSPKILIDYLYKRLWAPLGMEFPSYLTIDSFKHNFPKFESGICCTPIDITKFGRLYLNNGSLNGNMIINPDWINQSLDFSSMEMPKEYYNFYKDHVWNKWLASGKGSYKNFWWGYKVKKNQYDYFAMGMKGQILYICPSKNIIALRLGNRWGVRGWWPTIMRNFIEHMT